MVYQNDFLMSLHNFIHPNKNKDEIPRLTLGMTYIIVISNRSGATRKAKGTVLPFVAKTRERAVIRQPRGH